MLTEPDHVHHIGGEILGLALCGAPHTVYQSGALANCPACWHAYDSLPTSDRTFRKPKMRELD